jgi:hypothetical protein
MMRLSFSGVPRTKSTSLLPNAGAQPRLEAGAQRTLEGVGCSALFGSAIAQGASCPLWDLLCQF